MNSVFSVSPFLSSIFLTILSKGFSDFPHEVREKYGLKNNESKVFGKKFKFLKTKKK